MLKPLAAALLAVSALTAHAAEPAPSYGERLEGFTYPWTLSTTPSVPRASRWKWAIWTWRRRKTPTVRR